MNFLKTICITLTVGLALIGETVSAQLAQTPFNGSFLAGNYLLILNTNAAASLLATNFYSGTNIWVKGGISITNGAQQSPYFTPIGTAFYQTNTAAFTDVGLWYDRDGTVPSASINVILHGQDTRATNTLTFNFATMSRGVPNNQAQNLWSFSCSANGTNLVGLNTNLPTALLQGAHGMRLLNITSGNGTNVFLDYCDLKGFKP